MRTARITKAFTLTLAVALLAAGLVAPTTTRAQTANTGVITGTV